MIRNTDIHIRIHNFSVVKGDIVGYTFGRDLVQQSEANSDMIIRLERAELGNVVKPRETI